MMAELISLSSEEWESLPKRTTDICMYGIHKLSIT